MIHLVFQQANVEVLKKVQDLDITLAGNIVEIKDDFAVGPIENIDTDEGWKVRVKWWQSLLEQSPYATENLAGSFDDRQTILEIKRALEENEGEELWIWMGQNSHDVCSYYWVVAQLQKHAGKVMVLYMVNLPFLNEKGQLFYPTTLHQIQPKEFLKAKKLCRKITPSEFEIDPDEWKKLSSENAAIRILEGGKKIEGKEDSYFDKDIITGLSTDWQKGGRALHSILTKMKDKTGDVFLLSRIKKLVEDGKIEMTGDPAKGWKEFELRLPTSPSEAVLPNDNNS
ncbi:MAG: DUF1835 domain-containing protein [Chitinophagaceae bacterium]